MAKQDDYTRYTIRIPTPLYERVKRAAGEKSVNAEIVAILEEKHPAPVVEEALTLEDAREIRRLAAELGETHPATGEFWAIKRQIEDILVQYEPELDPDSRAAPEMR